MTDASDGGTEGRLSIVLVVLDTLRKDAFDRHFDCLSGRRFESAWATSNWTVLVHASLFTGRYASEAGVHAKSPRFDYPGGALPERLSEAGYTTRAYSCNVNVSPGRGFDRGFDEFEGNWRVRSLGEGPFDWTSFAASSDREGLRLCTEGVWRCLRSDAPTAASLKRRALLKLRDIDFCGALLDDGARSALRWLERTDFGDDEFLFVKLMETHSPHLPPRGYRTVPRADVDCVSATLDAPSVPADQVRQAYDDSVRYLSDAYRRTYGLVRAEFDYVVTLSDHGELLGEHGAWDHLYGLFPELTRVPPVIDGPRVGGIVTDPVSLLDVHATVLDIAGLDHDDSQGRPVLDDIGGCEFLTEYHGLSRIVVESARAKGLDSIVDDTELALKIRKNGKRVVFDPAVRYREAAHSGPPKPRSQKDRRAIGLLRLLWRQRGMLDGYGKYGRVVLPFNWWFMAVSPWLLLALVLVATAAAVDAAGTAGLAIPVAVAVFVVIGSFDRWGPVQPAYSLFDTQASLWRESVRLLRGEGDGTWDVDGELLEALE